MEFYAVTVTSVYRVTDKTDELGVPIVEKIALNSNSRVAIGERLRGGTRVCVSPDGIILYNENNENHPSPNGGRTSPIIALFLDRERAMECLESEKSDSRWEEETKKVLNRIKDNPVFIISYDRGPP